MTILVCGPTSYFADDVHTHCATCAGPIVYRPHAPADSIKLCGDCAVTQVAGDHRGFTVRITEETAREIAFWRAAPRGTH